MCTAFPALKPGGKPRSCIPVSGFHRKGWSTPVATVAWPTTHPASLMALARLSPPGTSEPRSVMPESADHRKARKVIFDGKKDQPTTWPRSLISVATACSPPGMARLLTPPAFVHRKGLAALPFSHAQRVLLESEERVLSTQVLPGKVKPGEGRPSLPRGVPKTPTMSPESLIPRTLALSPGASGTPR